LNERLNRIIQAAGNRWSRSKRVRNYVSRRFAGTGSWNRRIIRRRGVVMGVVPYDRSWVVC